MQRRYNSDAIRGVLGTRLERVSTHHRYLDLYAYIGGGNPSPSSSTPFRYKEAESMAGPEGYAGEESPFFTLKPIVVLDIVGVCE